MKKKIGSVKTGVDERIDTLAEKVEEQNREVTNVRQEAKQMKKKILELEQEEILQNIEDLTKLEPEDCRKLEYEITEGELLVILRNKLSSAGDQPCMI